MAKRPTNGKRAGWTTGRLRKSTVAALLAYREDCQELRELGIDVLRPNGSPGEGKPSIDAVCCRLLELVAAHRERARQQRRRRSFDMAWTGLSCRGECDRTGGAEYTRLRTAYIKDALSNDPADFIRRLANRPADASPE
jgi:hypothetical protein